MSLTFYCYPKCTTCKRAEKFLKENNIDYKFMDIKEENPTEDIIREILKKADLPIKNLFNTSGLLYKSMALKDKLPTMAVDEQIKLLASDGMIVKRPIILGEDFALVGFKAEQWESRFIND